MATFEFEGTVYETQRDPHVLEGYDLRQALRGFGVLYQEYRTRGGEELTIAAGDVFERTTFAGSLAWEVEGMGGSFGYTLHGEGLEHLVLARCIAGGYVANAKGIGPTTLDIIYPGDRLIFCADSVASMMLRGNR